MSGSPSCLFVSLVGTAECKHILCLQGNTTGHLNVAIKPTVNVSCSYPTSVTSVLNYICFMSLNPTSSTGKHNCEIKWEDLTHSTHITLTFKTLQHTSYIKDSAAHFDTFSLGMYIKKGLTLISVLISL